MPGTQEVSVSSCYSLNFLGLVFLGHKDKNQICEIHHCLPSTCLGALRGVGLNNYLLTSWNLGTARNKLVKESNLLCLVLSF